MSAKRIMVIGAGVVGCAIARQLARSYDVTVLECHDGPGQETSRFNSGVIHSGIHLPPHLLKAELAQRGGELIRDYCHDHAIALRKVGMHIVVAGKTLRHIGREIGNLRNMIRRAAALHIPLYPLDGLSLRLFHEPNIRCIGGIFIPDVFIIDQSAFVQNIAQEAARLGANFVYRQEVTALRRFDTGWIVQTPDAEYRTDVIINAAGLAATEIAAMAGYRYKQYFYRGEYYEISPLRSNLTVRSLVYPVHQPGQPGLGVHLTPTIDGRILVGPNAKRVRDRSDYDHDRAPAQAFYEQVASFLPSLRPEDLVKSYAGIRPKLSWQVGENDFTVRREPEHPIINLIGIESPGFTASLALAEHVVRLL